MAAKRKSTSSLGSAKRRKISHDDSPSPAARRSSPDPKPQLTAEQRNNLTKWLDDKAQSKKAVAFPITFGPVTTNSKKKKGKRAGRESLVKSHEKILVLDEREYGRVEYSIGNRARWDQLARYSRCTGMSNLIHGMAPVSYTHLTLPTIYSV